MGKSLIQVANPSPQNVAEGGIINLGSVQRRYGCNLRLSGNAIEVNGDGYYTITGIVTVVPTGTGTVTVAICADGDQIPGVIASSVGTAASPVTLPLVGTIRQFCCSSVNNLTCVLVAGAGSVQNISLRVTKE